MKLFKNFRTKKKKFNGLKTLEDCKKYYLENPDYRYVVVAGREKNPYSIHTTIKGAWDEIESNFKFDAPFPMEVIDLLYEISNGGFK